MKIQFSDLLRKEMKQTFQKIYDYINENDKDPLIRLQYKYRYSVIEDFLLNGWDEDAINNNPFILELLPCFDNSDDSYYTSFGKLLSLLFREYIIYHSGETVYDFFVLNVKIAESIKQGEDEHFMEEWENGIKKLEEALKIDNEEMEEYY